MKKRDYLLFILIIICIIISTLLIYTKPSNKDAYLQIRTNNQIYGEYPLNKNQTITINDTNTCIINNNKVEMSHANCPDKLCVHSKAIDDRGGSIICLPNQVILEIITNKKEIDTMT